MITDTSERDTRLQSVLCVSREMLDAAECGDWQQFAELEQGRRSDIMACFDQPVNESEAPLVRDSIEQLMQLNDQLTSLLQKARDESAGQLLSLQQGRRAVGAYSTC